MAPIRIFNRIVPHNELANTVLVCVVKNELRVYWKNFAYVSYMPTNPENLKSWKEEKAQ